MPSATARKMRVVRGMGQVADAFKEETIDGLGGHLAIGHTRYSTAGDSTIENAQPFLIDCAHGQIAVGHNGNFVNARELRDELVRAGSIFQTTSDTEVVLHLYARSKAPTRRGGAGRVDLAGQRRVLDGAAHQEPADRRARSARVPPAGAGPARRRLDRLLGDLRAGSDWRHLRARSRAGRAGHHQRWRAAVDQAVSARAARALRVRARLLRAARQLRVRPERQRGADVVRPHPRRRVSVAGRRRRADTRLRRVRGDRIQRSVGRSAPVRPDPESLRRPDLHPAAAVDPRLRREGEAEPGPEHSRRPARRAGRRFDRARNDQPQDRPAGQGGGRAGSARPHQLPADRSRRASTASIRPAARI